MTRTRKTTNKVSKDETRMSFWDHLEVLRGVLLRSVLYVCAFTCLGLIFKNLLFDVILAPTREDFCVYRMLGWSFGMDLINVEVSAQFFVSQGICGSRFDICVSVDCVGVVVVYLSGSLFK